MSPLSCTRFEYVSFVPLSVLVGVSFEEGVSLCCHVCLDVLIQFPTLIFCGHFALWEEPGVAGGQFQCIRRMGHGTGCDEPASVVQHSEATSSIFFITTYKDSHEKGLPELLRKVARILGVFKMREVLQEGLVAVSLA